MRLKNFLIVTKNIEKAKQFYHDLFGLQMMLDNDGNMILTEGLVLQDEKIWRDFLVREILPENNACELYFEEPEIEIFIEKLETLYPDIKYVNKLMTHHHNFWHSQKPIASQLSASIFAVDYWGQKVIRFYDLDGNLIEVGTPMK